MDEIEKYVESVIQRKSIKFLKMNFIGGEPLMASKQLLYIYNKLTNLCDKNMIETKSVLNTNGVLLTPEFLANFKNLDVSITLTPKSDHDKVRAFINKEGSYDIIINNIKKCREAFNRDDINLLIRYNTNGENYKLFSEFLITLKALNVNIEYVEPMYTDEYEQNNFKNTLTKKKFVHWNSTDAIDALVQNGYAIRYEFQNRLMPCRAYLKYSCKIYTDGDTGLCDASKYIDKGLNIKDINKDIDLINRYYKDFKEWNPFKNDKCTKCADLIMCGGNFFCKQSMCDYKRYDLEDFIRKFIEYSKCGKGSLFECFN